MSNFVTPYNTLAEIAALEDNLQIKLKHAASAQKWTAEEIAAGLGTTVKTIATQKTYLSWQNIIVQKREDGVLYIADEAEAEEIKAKRAERKKNGPAGTAADPVKLAKLANERLAKYKANIAELEDLEERTESQEDELAILEARVTIEEIRLKRLGASVEVNDEDADGIESEENEDEVPGTGEDADDLL